MSGLGAQIIVLAPNFNSEGVVEWGVKNIIPLILLVVGIGIIAGARKGQMAQNAMTVTNILLGLRRDRGRRIVLRVRRQHRQLRLLELTRMLVRPDDEVYRVDAVWLGPQGLTLPWTARYSAYGIWVVLFVGVLLVEAVLPMYGEHSSGVGARADDPGHLRPDRRHRPRPTPGHRLAAAPLGVHGTACAGCRQSRCAPMHPRSD